jgi:hypothetical protein
MKDDMKNRKKERAGRLWYMVFALLLILSSSRVAAAHDNLVLHLANSGLGKQFAITVKGLSSQAVLQIQTPGGTVLVARTIQDSVYQRIYNLEHLQEGPYVLVLKMPTREIYQPIEVGRRAIAYDANQRMSVSRPTVRVKGRQVDVELENPALMPVRISLLTEDGALLYEETIEQVADVEKRLNLLNVPRGDYQMRVQTPVNDWRERISLR